MFCPLEQIELQVSTCPVKKCIYKTPTGKCAFTELTEDNLDARQIAEVKGDKAYKVNLKIKEGVKSIKIGLAIDQYSDFVKSSYPRTKGKKSKTGAEVVNTKGSHTGKVLRKVFGLAANQQKKFWSEQRFNEWTKRTDSAFTLSDIRESLAQIKL